MPSFITRNRIIGAIIAGLSGPILLYAAHATNIPGDEYFQITAMITGMLLGLVGAYFLLDPDSAENS